MKTPFLPPDASPSHKLEALRQLFPEAVQSDPDGRVRVNPAGIQMALDPGNTAGGRVEEDGYELRWVGKREAYHQAFVPTAKILSEAHDQSKGWDGTGNLLIKGDNWDALFLSWPNVRFGSLGSFKFGHTKRKTRTRRVLYYRLSVGGGLHQQIPRLVGEFYTPCCCIVNEHRRRH